MMAPLRGERRGSDGRRCADRIASGRPLTGAGGGRDDYIGVTHAVM